MTKTDLEFGISVIVICDLEFFFAKYSKTTGHLYRQSHCTLTCPEYQVFYDPKKEAASTTLAAFFDYLSYVLSLVTRVLFEKVQKGSTQGSHHTHANCSKRTIESNKKNGVARIVPWYIPGQ